MFNKILFKTKKIPLSFHLRCVSSEPKFAGMVKILKTKYLLPFLMIIICSSTEMRGGGFQINMLGMKATSMSGVATGFRPNSTSVFHNPGAMSFLEYSQISVGAAFSIPSTSYLSPYTSNTDMEDQFYTPLHIYAVGKLNEKSAIGLSINTPFHMRSKWSDDWTGKYITKETNLNAVYIQPTYSYLVSEKIGIGGGPVVAIGRAFHTHDIPVAASAGNDIEMELDGKSVGFGFNIGIFMQASDEFTMGLNYRSSVKMNVKSGDAHFSNVPSTLVDTYPEPTEFATEYTLPSVLTAGASLNLSRELIIGLDVNYTFWNVFDSLSYEFNNHEDLNYGSGKFYKNAVAVRIGAQYQLNDKIDLRAGVAFDQTPVKDDCLSPENPDNDRLMFSLGGSMKFGEHVSVDLAYMLQNMKEREALNVETNFGGSYKSIVNIFGITLNYQF
jgi:long-chain fatty acid transport protein